LSIRTAYIGNAGADSGGKLAAGAEARLKGEGKDQETAPQIQLGPVECED